MTLVLLRALGDVEEAKLIYRYKYDKQRGCPPGWRKLGSGVYRTAYLAPSGLVYKVAHKYNTDWASKNNNDDEFNNYIRIARKNLSFRGWKIPKLYAYTWLDDMSSKKVTVNVMEFVDGYHESPSSGQTVDELADEFEHVFDRFGLYDCQPENWVLTPSGHRYIVDLAC